MAAVVRRATPAIPAAASVIPRPRDGVVGRTLGSTPLGLAEMGATPLAVSPKREAAPPEATVETDMAPTAATASRCHALEVAAESVVCDST